MTALTKIAGVVSGATLAVGLMAGAPAGAATAELNTAIDLAGVKLGLPQGATVAKVSTPAGTALAHVQLPAGVSLDDLALELDCDLTGATVTASGAAGSDVNADADSGDVNADADLRLGSLLGSVGLLGSGDSNDDTCSAADIEASGLEGVEVQAMVDVDELVSSVEGTVNTAGSGLEAGAQVAADAPTSAGAGIAAGTGDPASATATARVGSASGTSRVAAATDTTTAGSSDTSPGTEVQGTTATAPSALARTGAGLGGLTLAAGAFLGGGRLFGLARRLLGG